MLQCTALSNEDRNYAIPILRQNNEALKLNLHNTHSLVGVTQLLFLTGKSSIDYSQNVTVNRSGRKKVM